VTRRRVLIVLGVVVAALVVVPVAWGDLYANLDPGGTASPAIDRYPLDHYHLDTHFSTVKASLTGGVDASGVPAMIVFVLAAIVWAITYFCAYAVISLFSLAFSLDLLNGSSSTAGAGALAPVSDAIHNLYANTFGTPWMEVAVGLAGCWAVWRALVQRRFTETASALGMSLVFCLLAMAIVARPDATIGTASHWNNRVATAFLSVTSHGEVTSGPEERHAVSDQLFNMLVFRPWVALEFGGVEHCVRRGTGSKDHDPESVPVRPLADDPRADARALAQLHRTGHVVIGDKECVDNAVRYAGHFLRYPEGSDDRDAEYDAINRADPSKLPDSDPDKNTYKPSIVDKSATDAMEKGGQFDRLLLALVILVGELGAFLLLGSLSVSVLMAAMVVLLLAGFSPVALVAAVIPGRGHALFKTWAGHLATYLVRKAVYALVLAVLLSITAALQDATSALGWLLSFATQSMLYWVVFLNRRKLADQLIGAVAGRQPEHDAQLRKLLGVAGGAAYLAHRWLPARRPRTKRVVRTTYAMGQAGPDVDGPRGSGSEPGPDAPPPPSEPPGAPPPPPGSPSPSDDDVPPPRWMAHGGRAHGPRRRGEGHGRDDTATPAHAAARGERPRDEDVRRSRGEVALGGGEGARRPRDEDVHPSRAEGALGNGEGARRPRDEDDHRPLATAPPSPADELRADELRRRGDDVRRSRTDELPDDDSAPRAARDRGRRP
jgi:hypothetical protein